MIMNENQNQLQSKDQTPLPVSLTKDVLSTMQPSERQIIERKYQSRPFGKMDEDEVRIQSHGLLLKINTVTGWSFPLSDKGQDILIDQFAKLLTEKFTLVNPDEMEYAFRNSEVENWGKDINLNLVKEVMRPYLEKRFEVSRIEEQKTAKELPPPDDQPMSDEEFLEFYKNSYKITESFELIPVRCFGILIRAGKIEWPEGKYRENILSIARANFFAKDKDKGLTVGEAERYIFQDCKRYVVASFWDRETENNPN